MILQVHDELIFEVVPEELEQLKSIVIAEMSGAAKLKVPLMVDWGTGNNWLEAH
jgi:DNA polymerase-1